MQTNPVLTRDLMEKEFIDLTEDDMGLVLEAHEMASFAYDMVCEMLGVKQ